MENYRVNELKNMDILQIVDSILSYESDYNKEYSHKWKNERYVELKKMKFDNLLELLLNYQISRLLPDDIKNEIVSYKKEECKTILQYKITNNSKVKTVEYMFDDDEIKF